MGTLFGVLTLLTFIAFIVGLIKPSLVIFWNKDSNRINSVIYLAASIILFVVTAVVSFVPFSIEKDVKDLTTKENVAFHGEAENDASLTINGNKVSINKNKFSVTYPLELGDNKFIVSYENESNSENKKYSITRVTEQRYKKIQAAIKAEEERKRKLEEKQKKIAERNQRIQQQFSAWDGAHRNLERMIKSNMHDPSSYEHVKTTYSDKGNYLIVKTIFRGKNAFGGTVLCNSKILDFMVVAIEILLVYC